MEGHIPVPGARLYFRTIGASGVPLVVLHGGPDFDHHYLVPELDCLASDFRLTYYDQRGRGRSSKDVGADDVDIESEIDDLDRLRSYFGFRTFALLGHSWGALLAIEYAVRHAERVSHLILMNPAPASHADLQRFRTQREATEAVNLAKMRAIAGTPAYAAGDIEAEAEYYRLHYARMLRRTDLLEIVVPRLRAYFTPADIVKARAIEDRLYAQTWRKPDYDAIARLGSLKIPLLAIHGEQDSVPLECTRHIADAVPRAHLVVLPDCGHFAYLERPTDVRDAIVRLVSPR